MLTIMTTLLKIVLITVSLIIGIPIITFIFYIIRNIYSDIVDKRKKKQAFIDYPLFAPKKVYIDLNYMNNCYSKLTLGEHIILSNQICEGYLMRIEGNDLIFSTDIKDLEKKERIPSSVISVIEGSHTGWYHQLRYFNQI